MRVDQWLWAIRVFKSRARAAAEIKAGSVRLNGTTCKPAHEVRLGQTITVSIAGRIRHWTVPGIPPARIGAKLVPDYAQELSTEPNGPMPGPQDAEAAATPPAGLSTNSR